MGRPRRYDRETLVGHARALWVEHGITGVTIRALSAASGASNGAVYHAFGSRDGLLARVWAREADGFLSFQRHAVTDAMADGTAVDGLVAAALAPAGYAETNADGARLLLSVTADDLMTAELTDDGHAQLRQRQKELGQLLVELAAALWQRRDAAAVTTVRYCVVDLPGTLLLRSQQLTDPLARHALERAVRGIAAEPPPSV
ncbi:TetR/AcrR family transcriptional regulator [Mycobacterium sp. 1274756.6]|uniref:TetR/AcrR family transcriptional regulator n=1 Tax=Mycobacterium sp. 1274756.6 TaxID=1834076 RepID=UPI0007FCB3AF|nr:TetR/AcrR family transcriptional regulator [Mycobacterium sp. 1274756.6]OBJ71008.1 hypothetical protein A5643_08955 [Mycobacterium sp. 1274756.6]